MQQVQTVENNGKMERQNSVVTERVPETTCRGAVQKDGTRLRNALQDLR